MTEALQPLLFAQTRWQLFVEVVVSCRVPRECPVAAPPSRQAGLLQLLLTGQHCSALLSSL